MKNLSLILLIVFVFCISNARASTPLIIRGFESVVTDLAIKNIPNDKLLVTVELSGTLRVFSIKKAKENLLWKKSHFGYSILTIMVDAGHKTVLVGGDRGFLRAYDLVSGKLLQTFEASNIWSFKKISSVIDGYFATGTTEGKINMWRLGETKPVATFNGFRWPVFTIQMVPESDRLVVASGNEIASWNISTENKEFSIFNPDNDVRDTQWINAIDFSTFDGTAIVATDKRLRFLSLMDQAFIDSYQNHEMEIRFVKFSDNLCCFLSSSLDGETRVTNMSSKNIMFQVKNEQIMNVITLSDDGRSVAGANILRQVLLWQIPAQL